MIQPNTRHNHQPSAASDYDWMPWAWCNLSRNPFGELTRQERAELAIVDVDEIAARVQQPFCAVQFIGDCGRGKTTRMLALHNHLPKSSYAYLPEDEPCPSIAAGDPVLIDEAQRLPRRVRNQVFASGLPLVLATHRELTRPLRRHGYQVFTQEIGGGNTPALLYRILNRRIQASRLDPNGEAPTLSLDVARQLVARYGNNIRQIESYLYEMVQSQSSRTATHSLKDTNDGQMRFID